MKLQKHISKYLFILVLFTHTLFGCALCTVYSPLTQVAIKINATKDKIDDAKITWVLTKEFTDQLKQIYDRNQNNYLDKSELKPIEQSLLDYIKPKNFLTHISYDKIINKDKSEPIKIKKYKVYIKNSLLHFEYFINLDYKVIEDNILYIKINDDENYFVLVLAKNSIKLNADFDYKKVLKRQDVAFFITPTFKEKELSNKEVVPLKQNNIEKKQTETLLSKFTKKVKHYLLKIKQGDTIALFTLLFVSFIYGIIHALGPGHGKSLAFAYFSSNKSSYLKAFFISQLTAFIHILGALILVVISVFILQSVLNNFINDSVEILTKISSILIVFLALYILFNKFKHNECSCSSCCSTSANVNPTWSVKQPKTMTNLKPNFMKKDLYFVLTAGLIPCPGTVVLFIYAFILKTYFAVILASIFISLGMGVIIFLSSFLGVSVNKVSNRSQNFIDFIEYLAPIVMLILGVLLYFNAQYI